MNTRKLVASSLTALMIVAGNAVAAEQAPFPSSAHEVGGHWTGKVGRDSTPGKDIGIFPSAAVEFSSVGDVRMAARPARSATRASQASPFPSAASEFSSI